MMPAMDLLLNNALLVALGWTLVHFLWQGCIVALIFWLICVLAPRHAANLRYWSGIAGMMLSLGALLVTFSLSYSPEAHFSLDVEPATAVNPFLVLSGRLPDAWVLLQTGIEPALPWVVLLWFIGVVFFSVGTVRDWLGVRKLLHEGLVGTEIQLQVALERIKAQLGVQLPVKLLASTRVLVPLAVGCLRPVILMPLSVLARLPRDQVEMILAHELGHIQRYDYAFNLLQVVMETLLFYHPAIAWMSRRVREEREHCCDDLVVRVCGRPATYARALANLEVIRSPEFLAAIPATGGNLLARIQLIIDNRSPARSSFLAQFALAAIAGLMVAFGAQQGYSLSAELNRVAISAQLQGSDVQWKTWGRSRATWGKGVAQYGQSVHKSQLAEMKRESLFLRNLAEQQADFQTATNLEQKVGSQLAVPHLLLEIDANMGAISPSAELLSAEPMTLNSPAVLKVLPDDTQIPEMSVLAEPQVLNTALSSEMVRSPNTEVQWVKQNAITVIPLKGRPPIYPWRARKQGVEGFVELEFSINAAGKVTDVTVVDALPEGMFEKAASNALSKWTFTKDENTGSRFRQVFDFELQDVEKGPPRSRNCAVTGSRTCGIISQNIFVVWVNETTRKTKGTGLK